MYISRVVVSLSVLLFVSGCKITQVVPEGGTIVSRTGNHDCAEGQTCVIDVENGTPFSDTFTAVPLEGYYFTGWKTDAAHLCGGSMEACALEGIPGSFTSIDVDFFLAPEFLPTAQPLAAEDVQFERYVDFQAQMSLLIPSHLEKSRPAASEEVELLYLREVRESQDDAFGELIVLTRAAQPGLPIKRVATQSLISSTPFSAAGFSGAEEIYELTLEFLPEVDLRAQYIAVEFAGEYYGVVHVAEVASFPRNQALARSMADSLVIGQAVFDIFSLNSDRSNPGKPAIASDGDDFLVVTCRRESANADPGLFGRFIRGDRSMGTEFPIVKGIKTFNTGCRHVQPHVVFDGSNYLLAYVDAREVNRRIYARRISSSGELLDAQPIAVSGAAPGSAYSPALAFDGSRSLVAWYSINDDDLRIMGAFVDSSGVSAGPFTIADGLAAIYPSRSFGGPLLTVEAASSGSDFMVVWNKYYFGDTLDSTPRPLYGQVLDLSGNPLANEPILIREDAGTNPRYAEVESDGQDYLVVWAEGRLETNTVFSGRTAIYGQRISAIGQPLAPTLNAPVLVADPDYAASAKDDSPPSKSFLDLGFDGDSFNLIWTSTFGPGQAVYSAELSADLSEIAEPVAVSGLPENSTDFRSSLREGAIAFSSDKGIVSWGSSFVEAWVFDKNAGVASLDPASGIAGDPSSGGSPGSGRLNRSDVPYWFSAVEQATLLGSLLNDIFGELENYGSDFGPIGRSCRFGGRISWDLPAEGATQNIQYDDCQEVRNLILNGEVLADPGSSVADYTLARSFRLNDLTLSRGDSSYGYTGTGSWDRSLLALSDPRIVLDTAVSVADAPSHSLQGMAFSVNAENRLGTWQTYQHSGSLQGDGGTLGLGSSAVGSPIVLLGAENTRAEFEFLAPPRSGGGYATLSHFAGVAQATSKVRVTYEAIESGDVEFLPGTGTPIAVGDNSALARLGVDQDLRITSGYAGAEGEAVLVDVLGAITHGNAAPLTYELGVVDVEVLSDSGSPLGVAQRDPAYQLSSLGGSRFSLLPETPGLYRLRLVGVDAQGNRSDFQSLTLRIATDTDRDGFWDQNDPDDDNDGIPDGQDDLPKDPDESKDSDDDGIGDNADTDTDNDGVPDAADAYPLNPGCAAANEGNGTDCYVDIVGSRRKLFDGESLFFYEPGSNDVARWDVGSERFVDPLIVGNLGAADDSVVSVALMPNHNRLYAGYESGKVTYIRLDGPGVEEEFIDVPRTVTGLIDGVNFLLVFQIEPGSRGRLSSERTLGVYSIVGDLTAEGRPSGGTYVYDEAQGLFIGGFESGDLDINTGQMIPIQDKLAGTPLASSPDGRYSVRTEEFNSGTGSIVEVESGEVMGTLPWSLFNIANVVWTEEGISFVADRTYYRVNRYGETLERFELSGDSGATLYEYGGELLLVKGRGGSGEPLQVARFQPCDDTDGDGVSNLADPFPNHPEASLDADRDGYPDAWNTGYSDPGDSGLALDAYPGAIDCFLPAHGDGVACDVESTLNSVFDASRVATGDGIIYMLGDRRRLYRYSIALGEYISSLPLGSTSPYQGPVSVDMPLRMAWSEVDRTLYFAYGGRAPRLTAINPADGVEMTLSDITVFAQQLVATRDYLVLGVDDFRTVRYFYDKQGRFVKTSDTPRLQNSMSWDPVENRLYVTSTFSGVYVEDLEAGEFTGEATLLADLSNTRAVRVSPDGQRFVMRDGNVYNTSDGSVHAALPGAGSFAVDYRWLSNGGLARLGQNELQIFDAALQLQTTVTDLGSFPFALFEFQGAVHVLARSDAFGPNDIRSVALP